MTLLDHSARKRTPCGRRSKSEQGQYRESWDTYGMDTYVANVVSTLGGIREAAVGRALSGEAVNTARAPGNLGATELLDGSDTSQGPEVAVRDPRELLLDGLE